MNTDISQKARLELSEKLSNILKIPYQITDQQAGIRPASKTRRPFLHLHTQYSQLAVMNGLGTKGISLSPYFATLFADFLENPTENGFLEGLEAG
jgi:glycine oxidase